MKIPIVGDFNGDGYDDIGVYIPQSTTNNWRWAINLNNKNGSFASQHYIDAYDIGGPGERPIVADFNGDGLDDIGIQIPSTQRWVVATTPSNGGVFYHHAHISLSRGETIDGDVVVDDSVWSNPGNLIDGDLSANNSTVRNDGTIQGTTTASHSTIAGDGEYHGGLILDHSVVSPGNGPGVLTTGGVDFGQGSTLRVELNGGSSGTGYDQLRVNASVKLSNASLVATLGYTPALGQEFVIVNNDGTDAVIGTFAGLAEGDSLLIGENRFHITYRGGDGNDVVLRRNRPPLGANASETVDEDASLSSSVSNSDPDGDSVAVQLLTSPSRASSFAIGSNGSFSYRAVGDFSGTDSFTYRVYDGEQFSMAYTETINVTPVADAPTLSVANASGSEMQPFP